MKCKGSRLRLFLVLASLASAVVRGDILHYYKLKKFLTAVAFAQALGRRPTILPVPIPIPIPIGQNEVIRIPGGSAKTVLNLAGGGHGAKYLGKRGGLGKFTGSSAFGYPLPGSFDSLGGNNNILVLDGASQHGDFFDGGHNALLDGISDYASPSVVRVVSSPRGALGSIMGRKPRRYIVRDVRGIRTTRESDMELLHRRRVRKRRPQHLEYQETTASSAASGEQKKKKKPIPVGEKFMMP